MTKEPPLKSFKKALLAVFACEFIFFLAVAQRIGFFEACFLTALASAFGVYLLRKAGWDFLAAIVAFKEGTHIFQEAQPHHIIKGLAGSLFFIPGFLTDILAVLLLVPSTRRKTFHILAPVLEKFRNFNVTSHSGQQPDVIELDKNDYQSFS